MEEAVRAFAKLVANGEPGLENNLDHALLLIAQAAQPGLDVEEQLVRLDSLAERAQCATPQELAAWLFGEQRFVGNRADYYNPENSYLNRVLDEGRGIPITLSALFIEIGRRQGMEVHAVGMPGHFLTQIAADTYVDAFDGGTVLDGAGCEQLFQRLAGQGVPLPPGSLAHTTNVDIVRRVLANLRQIAEQTQGRNLLAAVIRLRAAMPAPRAVELLELANLLARQSAWGQAADAAERAATLVSEARADSLLVQATQWRARLN